MGRIRMKQTTSSGSHKRSMKSRVSYFDNIPNDLIGEVLARVAASSVADLVNAKSSCKVFQNIGEDSYVYRHATLKNFPVVAWWPANRTVTSFLNKCWESGNPESLYRQGVVDYFGGSREEFALECLKKAAKSGHVGAFYLISIILIFLGHEYKERGIIMLSKMKKLTKLRKQVRECRNDLKGILNMLWINNTLFLEQRPTCCTVNQHMIKKVGWPTLEDDEEDSIECEACICDKEISSICRVLPNHTY